MEKVFVDTSAWVAYFAKNDGNHKQAAAIYDMLKTEHTILYTSDYVLDETITMLGRKSTKKQSIIAGDILFASRVLKIIHVCPEYLETSWMLYKKYSDKAFSFTDITSFAIMKEFEISKAFTFDEHFRQMGFEIVNT